MSWWFEGWRFPLRALLMAVFMFLTMLAVVRIGGKRVLTKMNVFDFVFTVAIGSTVAAVIMDHEITYVEGLLAVVAFAAMQVLMGWLSMRWTRLDKWINGRPSLLLRDGALLHDELRKQKISQEEILAALRIRGITRFDEAAAVVLETDGQFSVLRHGPPAPQIETLVDVEVPRDGAGPLDLDRIHRKHTFGNRQAGR